MINLPEILKVHAKWLNADTGGARAVLLDANLRSANLRCANLSGADLSGANLRCADLRSADLDFASWPLHCGGTLAQMDRHLSLQLIYHAFNQNHQDPAIVAALEVLRPLAQEFIDNHRHDATELRNA